MIEQYGQLWHQDTLAQAQAMSEPQRCDYHQTHSLPVMENIRQWGKTHMNNGTVEENSGPGKAIQYHDKHFDGLTAFCRIPGAQPDNNKMENQLKLVIRDRKNAMFRKTHGGIIL